MTNEGTATRSEHWSGQSGFWLLIAITAVCLSIRYHYIIGYGLGDDLPYTERIHDILDGRPPIIGPVGQYEYRLMWLYPIAWLVKLFGWNNGLILYPCVSGAFVPLLTAIWLKRHFPESWVLPNLCALILATYPILNVDSLLLVNEIPMLSWCLISANCFSVLSGKLYVKETECRQIISIVLWGLSLGASLAAAYMVKASAVPTIGVWILMDAYIRLSRDGWPSRALLRNLVFAGASFLLPIVLVQFFFFLKTGHILGNFLGEIRLYKQWIPQNYYLGEYNAWPILCEYIHQLFAPYGDDQFEAWLHGLWPWIYCVLSIVFFFRRKHYSYNQRRSIEGLILATVLLFLFFEFWPTKVLPYYLPNCFSGRPWRYLDIFPPLFAAQIGVITVHEKKRTQLTICFGAVLTVGFIYSGIGLAERFYEMNDRASDLRRAAVDWSGDLAEYEKFPHYLDEAAFAQLRTLLEWSPGAELLTQSDLVFDFRGLGRACIWTGGARREGLPGDAAWQSGRLKVIGGELVLLRTWLAPRRPWRSEPLRLWLFEPYGSG